MIGGPYWKAWAGTEQVTTALLLKLQKELKEPDLKVFCHMMAQGKAISDNFSKNRKDYDLSGAELAIDYPQHFAIKNSNGGLLYPLQPNDVAQELAYDEMRIACYVNKHSAYKYVSSPEDGWVYREGLMMQLLGRKSWVKFLTYLGLSNPSHISPSKVMLPLHYFSSGEHIFQAKTLRNLSCNFSKPTIIRISNIITFGTARTQKVVHDLDKRVQYTKEFAELLGFTSNRGDVNYVYKCR